MKTVFLLPVLFLKKKLLYIFVLVVKQPTPTILNNHILLHQIIMFIHVIYVLVGFMIYLYQNPFVNND